VYFSCEQKQTFLVHGGIECFMLVRNFPESDKRSLVVSNLGIPHLWLGNLTTGTSHLPVLLCSRITRLVRPSVRPSVRPVRAFNSKTKRRRKTKIGVNVPRTGVTGVAMFSWKVNGQADGGRTICWHWADIFF